MENYTKYIECGKLVKVMLIPLCYEISATIRSRKYCAFQATEFTLFTCVN